MTNQPTNQPTNKPINKRRRLSRRQFLVGAGVTTAGLCVAFYVGVPKLQQYLAENVGSFLPQATDDPNAWLRVLPNNRVQFLINKMEMGQGIQTALTQIVADELEVAFELIDAPYVSTKFASDAFGTAGSFSVSTSYFALRRAAAEARETLKQLAAQKLGVEVSALSARHGRIVVTADATKSVAYGELVSDQKIVRTLKDKPALKDVKDFKVIGQNVPRIDIPDKVTGKAQYGYDMWVEGMLHGKVARPPTLGATVGKVNASAASQLPGVQVVVEGEFVGVVAQTEEQATMAINTIEIEWKEGRQWQQADIDALINVEGSGTVIRERGNMNDGWSRATQKLSATYRTPFATQTPMEVQGAVADVRGDNAKVWASTQAPSSVQSQAASAIGLKTEQVEVQPMYIGGGYGRKTFSDAAVDAARLSKAAGKPVRVAWSRADEFQYGHLRPPTLSQFEAGLDAQGNITAWDHKQASGLVLFSYFPAAMRYLLGSDFGAARGALTEYDFANQRTTAFLCELPVKTGPWRGLGLIANVFAVESFMDELAHAAKADPLEFRLRQLDEKSERMRAVLQAVAKKAEWGKPLGEGRGRGIACCLDAGSYVAQVAEVTVNRATGKVKVERVVTAFDCGLMVNPRNIEAQIEGNVMWGVSTALIEELVVKDGRLAPTNFDQYPIITMRDAPDTEHVLLNRPELPPSGVGEPPIGPVAAAVGNAIFNATGARLRQLPMTPTRVLAALKG
jgi:isoquinoline 1-oxidoreductase beta subunit